MTQLAISEKEVIEMVKRLSAQGKKKVLKSLILSDLDRFEKLVDYGETKFKELCLQRGINYESLTEEQKEKLIDEILHEN